MKITTGMPGFPTKGVGTLTHRGKARHYIGHTPAMQRRSCSGGLCPELWGLRAVFARRARQRFLPRGLPKIWIAAEFLPIERLRAGERIQRGVPTKTLANRVGPDVGGNGFHWIGGAQNVVVEFHLPERSVRAIFVRKGGALFEGLDETKEIGLGRAAFSEEMKMIGHQAKSVEQERMAGRRRNQVAQYHVAKRSISKTGFPVVTTDCDEIDAMAKIILRCEPDIFAAERHAQRVTRKRIGGNNNCIQTDTRRCRASRHTTRRKQGCLASGQKASGPSHTEGKPGATEGAGPPDGEGKPGATFATSRRRRSRGGRHRGGGAWRSDRADRFYARRSLETLRAGAR